MSLDERIGWLLLGCLIGFILGLIVPPSIWGCDSKSGTKRGFFNKVDHPISTVVMGILVILTAVASFQSQRATNALKEAQSDLETISNCNKDVLFNALSSLNERSTYNRASADANASMQRAQLDLLTVMVEKPPASMQREQEALNKYWHALNKTIDAQNELNISTSANPYPTEADLTRCLKGESSD